MEIVRRVFLVSGLLGAIWLATVPEPMLIEIAAPDFARLHHKRLRFEESRQVSLEDFIAKHTKDRLLSVQGQAWEALAEAARNLASGQKPQDQWSPRIGHSYADRSLYFRPEEPPVDAIVTQVAAMEDFCYVRIKTANRADYLTAGIAHPADAIGKAPSSMLYPWRGYAIWALLGGIALYVVLPRRRPGPQCLCYSRITAGLLPDLIGVMLSAVFFTIPLLVIPANSPTGDLFEEGWGILTMVCWGLMVFPLAIFAAAAWYTSLRIELLEDRFRRTTVWGTQDVLYAEIVDAQVAERHAPRWLTRLGFLVSLLNWRATGPTLLAASRSAPVLQITNQGGRRTEFLLDSLPDASRLLEALEQHGVSIK